jgi:hypothetical protein
MLSVIFLSFILQSVVMLSVIMPRGTFLIDMPSVVTLRVFVTAVVAPVYRIEKHF